GQELAPALARPPRRTLLARARERRRDHLAREPLAVDQEPLALGEAPPRLLVHHRRLRARNRAQARDRGGDLAHLRLGEVAEDGGRGLGAERGEQDRGLLDPDHALSPRSPAHPRAATPAPAARRAPGSAG